MSVYVTGDTHGPIDIQKLSSNKWPEGKKLTKDDYLIVLGDFGLMFYNEPTEEERHWTQWLNNKKFSVLFLDGNHDNHPRLNALPVEDLFGGKAGRASKHIYHLRRGEIYTIDNKKIFVFGGASSIDKSLRTAGVTWWREEVASHAEMEYGLSNLEKHQYNVDYILAHTAPQDVADVFLKAHGGPKYDDPDPTRAYLEHVCKSTQFKDFYCGHWHENWHAGKYHLLYEEIVRLI